MSKIFVKKKKKKRLNVPVNNVSVMSGRREPILPGFNQYCRDLMCLGGGGSMYTPENMSVKYIPGGIKCAPLKQNWGMQGYTYFAYIFS